MVEPVMAQKSPYVTELDAGEYWWCACGRSQKQPFCDGAHKGTGLAPLAFEIAEKKQAVALCGCKRTKNPPYCDGTHAGL